MILPKVRDPRFITLRRGGTLTDTDHHLLALWAADCADHVLPLLEAQAPSELRPRRALERLRAWTRGEIPMTVAREAAFAANAAGRGLPDPARFAALAAGQAVAVAHVAAHELGAAAYAIRAVRAASSDAARAGARECRWQRRRLPSEIRGLVLDDQRLRNPLCWGVFEVQAGSRRPRFRNESTRFVNSR